MIEVECVSENITVTAQVTHFMAVCFCNKIGAEILVS